MRSRGLCREGLRRWRSWKVRDRGSRAGAGFGLALVWGGVRRDLPKHFEPGCRAMTYMLCTSGLRALQMVGSEIFPHEGFRAWLLRLPCLLLDPVMKPAHHRLSLARIVLCF